MSSEENMIGQYEIVEQVGSGGMATVYRAYQAKLDRYVAVKMMHKSMQTDDNFLARFEREARIVAKLDHPNIVPIYDYDEHQGQPYLVMKILQGLTLKDLLLSSQILSLEDIQDLMNILASALTYAHSQGVLHRDIKPSNIIISAEGQPYLTDFGLARIATQGESTLSADVMLGTPHYISPEQAQGVPDLDAKTDVYSFGVILYELVTGRVPFVADTPYAIVHKHIYTAPPLPSEINPEVPMDIEDVLLIALDKDPQKRYETPTELMTAFNQAVARSGLTHLDDSRVQNAAAIPLTPQPQPPIPSPAMDVSQSSMHGKRKHVMIQPSAPGISGPTTFEGVVRDVGRRIRNAVDEFRVEIEKWQQDGDSKSTFGNIVEGIKQSISDTGTESRLSHAEREQARAERERRRTAREINKDWGVDEQSIRIRVDKRIAYKRDLVKHVIIYALVISMFAAGQGAIQSSLAEALSDPQLIASLVDSPLGPNVPDLTPLANINFTLIVALLWGAGLASNILHVFYNSGKFIERRRDALRRELESYHGRDWQDTVRLKPYKRIRSEVTKRFTSRISLFKHFFSFLLISTAAFVAWPPIYEVLTSAEQAGATGLLSNVLIVPMAFALFSGITVLVHAIGLGWNIVFGGEASNRAAQREITRERELSMSGQYRQQMQKHDYDYFEEKPKNLTVDAPPAIRLTGDGELTESFIDEIDQDEDHRYNQ